MKQGLCTHLTRSTREHPDILGRIFVAKKVTIRILGQTVWSNLPLLLCLTHTHTNYPQTESMWAGSMQATWSKSTERQQIVRMFEKGLKEEFKKRESDICPGLKGSLEERRTFVFVRALQRVHGTRQSPQDCKIYRCGGKSVDSNKTDHFCWILSKKKLIQSHRHKC